VSCPEPGPRPPARCPSTIHDPDQAEGDVWPPAAATVAGTFRLPWWEEGRTERITYCGRCADALASVHYFTPDRDEVRT
jgi:hypothetical protein